MKSEVKVLLMDAMFTLFIPKQENRFVIYQDIFKRFCNISASVEDIERSYGFSRRTVEHAEIKTEGKLPKGYYRSHWGRINAKILQYFNPCLSDTDAFELGQKVYLEVMGNPSYYKLAPEAKSFLAHAQVRGYHPGLVTNQEVESIWKLLSHFKISFDFEMVAVSDAERFKKPDPRFFASVIDNYKQYYGKSINIAFIGNNPLNDMQGSFDAGIPNRFCLDPKKEQRDTEVKVPFIWIDSLYEVFDHF